PRPIRRPRASFRESATKPTGSPSPVIAAGARAVITSRFWKSFRDLGRRSGARCSSTSAACRGSCAPGWQTSHRWRESARRWREVFMITCTRALEKQLMPWNLPNTLTWARIAAIPLIVLTAAIIIGREITISALREWMAEIGARRKVAVSRLSKYKTILQIIRLALVLYLLQ